MKTPRILFVGIDSSTKDACLYAKSKNWYTIITDYYPIEKSPLKRLSDSYWNISVTDLDLLEQKCKEEGINAIYAGNHELCLDTAKELCERLSLPFYANDDGWSAARNKTVFKSYCKKAGLPTPHRYPLTQVFETDILSKIEYPVITKPTDASSQKGFSICRNEDELRKGYSLALSFSENKDIIVEEYIEGPEFDFICYVNRGKLYLLCMNDRLGAMVNERMNQTFTPNQSIYLKEFTAKYLNQLQHFAEEIGYREGTLFFQAIRRDGEYYFLEMGLRVDGIGCWTTVGPTMHFNYVNCMVDLACGICPEVDLSKIDLSPEGKHTAIYLYWAKPGLVDHVEGFEKVKAMDGVTITIVRFRPGDTVRKTDNMLQIAYFIGIVGKNTHDLTEKLRFINENLRLVGSCGEDMMFRYEDYEYIENNY